jgi:hypothetical protein
MTALRPMIVTFLLTSRPLALEDELAVGLQRDPQAAVARVGLVDRGAQRAAPLAVAADAVARVGVRAVRDRVDPDAIALDPLAVGGLGHRGQHHPREGDGDGG